MGGRPIRGRVKSTDPGGRLVFVRRQRACCRRRIAHAARGIRAIEKVRSLRERRGGIGWLEGPTEAVQFWRARRLALLMVITIFHRLHHQARKRLTDIALLVTIPGKFFDAAGMLTSQRDKRLLTAQRSKLGPQKLALRETKRPQTLRTGAHNQREITARHLNDLYQIKQVEGIQISR